MGISCPLPRHARGRPPSVPRSSLSPAVASRGAHTCVCVCLCVAGMSYGRHGNPTHYALEEAFAVLEGGDNAVAVSSGVAAINAALLAFVQTGDHILVSDGVYDPTRSFCDRFLGKFGVRCTYFAPTSTPDQLARLFEPQTKVIPSRSRSRSSLCPADAGSSERSEREWTARVLRADRGLTRSEDRSCSWRARPPCHSSSTTLPLWRGRRLSGEPWSLPTTPTRLACCGPSTLGPTCRSTRLPST